MGAHLNMCVNEWFFLEILIHSDLWWAALTSMTAFTPLIEANLTRSTTMSVRPK